MKQSKATCSTLLDLIPTTLTDSMTMPSIRQACLAVTLSIPTLLATSLSATAASQDVTARFMASISDDGLVAVVNNSPILKSELNTKIKQLTANYQKAGERIPDEQQLKELALNTLIVKELQLSLAKRAGIRPNDTAINSEVAKYAKVNGYSSISALQQAMDSKQAGSYANLRNRIIDELAIQVMQKSQVARRIKVSQQDIETFLSSPEGKRLNQNQYQTLHVRVPYPEESSKISQSQKQVAKAMAKRVQNELKLLNRNDNDGVVELMARLQGKYPIKLQGGNMGYHPATALPANIGRTIIGLDVNEVSEPLETRMGIDVVKLAKKRVAEDMVIPQWHTRHILISVNELQTDELAKYKINDLYEQLRRGADFAKLAATYSDDPGSAGKGGDLDWVSEGNMVPEFENMMKNTSVGDFSVPFKSQYGWHILQVVDSRQYDASNEVRQRMAKEILYNRAAPQATEDWLQELRAKAYIRVFN